MRSCWRWRYDSTTAYPAHPNPARASRLRIMRGNSPGARSTPAAENSGSKRRRKPSAPRPFRLTTSCSRSPTATGSCQSAHMPRTLAIALSTRSPHKWGLAKSSDLEAVLRKDPDLMLLANRARADFEDVLRHASIPTFRVRTIFANFDQIAHAIAAVGYLTGDDAAAELQIRRLRERVERAKERRQPGAQAPRVLPYSTYGSTLGHGSLFDHILTELGAINVASEQGIGQYADISSEQVAAWDPEWIVAPADRGATEQVRDRLLADAGIAVTQAGRSGQILIVESRQFTTMSQHAVGLMEAISAGLYAEGK